VRGNGFPDKIEVMFDELLLANRRYAESFDLAGLPGRAAAGFALVTCIDTRIEPLAALGLRPGDAKILRNAGGRVTDDVLRSLVLATGLLGIVRIAVMHHTLCALAGQSDEQLRATLPEEQARVVQDWLLRGMPDPDTELERDVELVANCPAIPAGLPIAGWRYDVATGHIAARILTTSVGTQGTTSDSHR
jgi:carbonic anhydrase